MVEKVVIYDNTKSPVRYLSSLDTFNNGKSYEFHTGVNIIVGENGSGKTTLLKIIEKYPNIEVPYYYPSAYAKECANKIGWGLVYDTPQQAYADLIDKISGKLTWERNPYVCVYDFELVK